MNEQLVQEIKGLAKIATTGRIPARVATTYSSENNGVQLTIATVEDELRSKFAEIAPNKKAFKKTAVREAVYELMEETIDEIFPQRANSVFDRFVDFKNFSNGDKPVFIMPKGKGAVRRFIKRVALGVPMLKTRLDSQMQTMTFFALGGGVVIEWEHYLSGQYSFVDLANMLADELVNAVYDEIISALKTATSGTAFKKIHNETGAVFSVAGMIDCISYAQSYGAGGATIVGTPSFVSRIQDSAGFISDMDKADMRARGYIGIFRGASVVVIPQQYDKDGVALVDDKVGYIFPSGSRPEDRFIKVGYEGGVEIKEAQGSDWSLAQEIYAKLGVMVGNTDGVSIYKLA